MLLHHKIKEFLLYLAQHCCICGLLGQTMKKNQQTQIPQFKHMMSLQFFRPTCLVLHVGMHAVSIGLGKGAPVVPVASPHVDIFANLAFRLLDEEGQYVLVNAIANQLRYPNAHTHYFSCLLINLFGESRDECLKELITRCLLERLIVHRPQPWGLLVTFVELIKNPRYQFWQQPFVSCAEEIERLLTNLARNCLRAQGKTEKV